MTLDELAKIFIAAGGKEYKHPIDRDRVRAFQFERFDGPECECNDRAPSLHATAYNDFNGHEGNVEFEVCGEHGGEWLKAQMYCVPRDRAATFISTANRVLASIWKAYCNEMPTKDSDTGE